LGVEPIINAAGTLTTLGGSLILPEVMEAMASASRSFVDLNELHLAAGRRIAELVGVEAAHVCSGAASGIVLMAAACIAGGDPEKLRACRHKFVLQRAHHTAYCQGLRMVGGELVEIEADAGELERAVRGAGVAGVFYTFAWFCRGEVLPLSQVAEIAHRHGVPVIVDAAAEVPPVENLWRFVKEGADLVAFSGGKAIRGPQCTGFVLGSEALIEACRLNDNPHSAPGRPMKAGKEEIAGLVKAIELYVSRDHQAEGLVWDRRVARILDELSGVPHVRAWRQLPYGIGQQIPHAALEWDEGALGVTYGDLVRRLREGSPRIAVQLITPTSYNGFASSQVRIHPHTLREGEEVAVAERVRAVLTADGQTSEA